ncbi:MAG: hypothetical protein UZ05_CHB002002261 [Chlorobi bacterium OLB5]|nr:MAG: hypothetical protein UZ05_CHB002002261 [Chlorobi bacterium OLB5]
MTRKLLFLLIFLFPVFTFSQFDDLLKKTVVPDILEEKNITTSIDDALPVTFWVSDIDEYYDPVEPADYNAPLGPGYYRMTVQSYCLKAGTHGPTKGSGHLIAPIKGKLDNLVTNILNRSAEHPQIAQKDIQLLLWSIIYGAKFTDLNPELQLRVKPLLTPAEIAELSVGISDMPLDLLPDEVRSTAKFYKDLRGKITDPSSNFEDIESMAVLTGEAPSNMMKKQIDPGNWAYIGDGFYMRMMPITYSHSILELYRPQSVNITRDDKGRITLFEKDGNRIEISFIDEPGSDVLKADDGKYYPIYRFKSVKYIGTNPGEEDITENFGWMIRGDGKELKNITEYKNYPQDPSSALYKARLQTANDFLKKVSKYKNSSNNPGKGSENDLAQSQFNADKHQKDGMDAVKNPADFKKKSNWIKKHKNLEKDWWDCATNALAGGSCDDDDTPKKPNPNKKTAAPGNTKGQRIAPSLRKFGE